MKKLILIPFLLFFLKSNSQEYEATVLVLNWEKMEEIRKTITQVREAYQILETGYNKIKGVADGDFKLHDAFIQGLKEVNPAIKNYFKVADIIKYQKTLISSYKNLYKKVSKTDNFSLKETEILKIAAENMIKESWNNLDDLIMVITASNLSMEDSDRIKIIDRIHNDITNQLKFIKTLDQKITSISIHRDQEKRNNKFIKNTFKNEESN